MNVNILTYHFVDNYGAALQAYGLQKALMGLGHKVSIIDYRPGHLTHGGKFWFPTDRWKIRANAVIAYKKAACLRALVFGDGGKGKHFEKFHREHLNFSKQTYRTLSDLKKFPPSGDATICGSDQIWNSSQQFGIDPAYFLEFASKHQKTISYAASFGRPFIENRYSEQIKALLSNIEQISVRENSAVDIIRDLTNRKATWVPDPTFLVNDGYPEALVPQDQSSNYIFSYTLRSRELVGDIEKYVSNQVKKLIVSPSTLARQGRSAPGPLEWVGFIKSSDFVITNSFHGVAFSVILKRPFIFVGLSGVKSAFNERANSLLTRLGLSHRIVSQFDSNRLDQLISESIDWKSVDQRLQQWRSEAFLFLRSALS